MQVRSLCAYELTDPDSGLPIKKPTGLVVSHHDMIHLPRTCPGHPNHKLVEGKCKDGENLSTKTSRYRPSFCRTWCKCLHEMLSAASESIPDKQILVELRKLHNNLGHPTNRDLVRILKNAGSSDRAAELPAAFKCDVCINRQSSGICSPSCRFQPLSWPRCETSARLERGSSGVMSQRCGLR